MRENKFAELSEILKKSKYLLCNDSGAMHLANALGGPVFAVLGSTIPVKETGPVFRTPVKIHKVPRMIILGTSVLTMETVSKRRINGVPRGVGVTKKKKIAIVIGAFTPARRCGAHGGGSL